MESMTIWFVRGMLNDYEAELACRKLGLIHVPGPLCYLHAVYTKHESEVKRLGKRVDQLCINTEELRAIEKESALVLKPLAKTPSNV